MTAQNASALPRIETESIGPRLQAYWEALTHWVHSNSVELGIAITAAVIVFLALSWLKPSKLAPSSLKQDSFLRQPHLFFGSPDEVNPALVLLMYI